MTMYETSDLHKRVERYESALDELRAAHQDIRHILLDQVLYERWLQIGAELGFAPGQDTAAQHQPPPGLQQDLTGLNHQIPQLADTWSS